MAADIKYLVMSWSRSEYMVESVIPYKLARESQSMREQSSEMKTSGKMCLENIVQAFTQESVVDVKSMKTAHRTSYLQALVYFEGEFTQRLLVQIAMGILKADSEGSCSPQNVVKFDAL